MIERALKTRLLELAKKHSIVILIGPRQSGKTTLLKTSFPNYKYVSLEDPDMWLLATEDPKGFLTAYPDKTIIDDIQRVPSLFSYIQTHTNKENKEGMYLLAGYQNSFPIENINQSFAEQTAILQLLPFSHNEMKNGDILPLTVDEEIFKGAYPLLYDQNITPVNYYQLYINTFLERDIRLMRYFENLNKFIRFLKLCAGHIGQLLNITSLANECGVTYGTATAWISILESNYICYLLKRDNSTKRLVKAFKLYFYDTGLACSLLDIRIADQINAHFLRGKLFENLVINEFIKQAYNKGEKHNISFWRDNAGNMVDLLRLEKDKQYAYEIKSEATYSPDFFKNISKWTSSSKVTPEQCFAIYNGDNDIKTLQGEVISWKLINSL